METLTNYAVEMLYLGACVFYASNYINRIKREENETYYRYVDHAFMFMISSYVLIRIFAYFYESKANRIKREVYSI